MQQRPKQSTIVGGPRFGLRTLFIVVTVAGLASGIIGSLLRGDNSLTLLFMGIGVFCYGGIIAIPCYALVGSLLTLSAKTTWGERAAEVLSAVVCAAAWIGFVTAVMARWPQVCVAYALVIVGLMAWIVRSSWQRPEAPSPEPALQRLLKAKRECPHQAAENHPLP